MKKALCIFIALILIIAAIPMIVSAQVVLKDDLGGHVHQWVETSKDDPVDTGDGWLVSIPYGQCPVEKLPHSHWSHVYRVTHHEKCACGATQTRDTYYNSGTHSTGKPKNVK